MFPASIRAAVCSAAFFVVSLLLAAAIAGSALAQNYVGEREDFHNTTYVNTDDDEMKKFLFLAGEAARGGDHPAAVANLIQALRKGGDALVSFGERTYLTGRAAAAERLAALPDPAFDLYLETVRQEAGRLLDRAVRSYDEILLAEVALRFPFTRPGFAAWRKLGDLAAERGDFLEAACRYKRYLKLAGRIDDRAAAPADEEIESVRLALFVVFRRLGRPGEAAAYVNEGSFYFNGGEKDPAALEELLPNASGEPDDSPGVWPTRGGGRSRAVLPRFDCTGLRLLWRYPLLQSKEEDESDGLVFSDLYERRRRKARQLRSSVYPVVWDGKLFVFDREALYSLDIESGRPVFGPLTWGWSLLFGDGEPDLENVSYSGTAAGGVLYVTLNHRTSDDDTDSVHAGTLQALDLARDGYCLWKVDARQEADGSPLAGMAFTGAPIAVEGRLFLLGTRHAALTEMWLLCFDAASGELLFNTFLCSGAEIPRFGSRGDTSQNDREKVELGAPVVECRGTLYCLTNLGVAAAADAFSGEILWLFKYNRLFAQDPDRFERSFFFDTGGWEDSLPLFRGSRFIFAPSDSRYFYTLAASPDPEGFIVLDDPVEKNRLVSFIGTDGRLCYFTAREGGRNFIAATDRLGAMAWETELFEKEDRITGRPLLSRTALFVPTERYIYRVDLQAGGLVSHAFFAPPGEGQDLQAAVFGNIITIGNRLISVSDREILVFEPEGNGIPGPEIPESSEERKK